MSKINLKKKMWKKRTIIFQLQYLVTFCIGLENQELLPTVSTQISNIGKTSNFIQKMERMYYRRSNHIENVDSMRLKGILCDVTIQVNKSLFVSFFLFSSNLDHFNSFPSILH